MRNARVERRTAETEIAVEVTVDGTGRAEIATGIGFFDHMLHQIARHGMLDLTVSCKGDLHIDDHHSVEDTGIALGQALREALGDKAGIRRYGSCDLVMDDALARAALDLSGRPYFVWEARFTSPKIGTFDVELAREFFQAFATNAGMTLHVDLMRGINAHHAVEAIFKAVARALRMAVEEDPRAGGAIPSTKEAL